MDMIFIEPKIHDDRHNTLKDVQDFYQTKIITNDTNKLNFMYTRPYRSKLYYIREMDVKTIINYRRKYFLFIYNLKYTVLHTHMYV